MLKKRDFNLGNQGVQAEAFGGNVLAFKNPAAYGVKNAGYHGYLPHSGPRRAVQVNYQTRYKNKQDKYVYVNDPRIKSGEMELPAGISLTVD